MQPKSKLSGVFDPSLAPNNTLVRECYTALDTMSLAPDGAVGSKDGVIAATADSLKTLDPTGRLETRTFTIT